MKEDACITNIEKLDYKLVKGRRIHNVVAASLYITCRRFKIPRTLVEIGELTGLTKRWKNIQTLNSRTTY